MDTIMRPRNFTVSARVRLGVPVVASTSPCPLCPLDVDVLGDHASCCVKTSDTVARHNRLRNLLNHVAGEGLLAPVMEKQGIFGPTSGRRPGDVTVPLWCKGKGLAIDVAVTSPFNVHNVSKAEPCESYAEMNKHRKYQQGFVGSDFDFTPMVFETTGGVNRAGPQTVVQVRG
jgi:hypothetical protein